MNIYSGVVPTRIQISGAVVLESGMTMGTFMRAAHAELERLHQDLARQEEQRMLRYAQFADWACFDPDLVMDEGL